MKKLAVVLNIHSNRNPVLLYCLRELGQQFELTVISLDRFEDAQKFPAITFINYFAYLKWSGRFARVILLLLEYVSRALEFFPKLFSGDFRLGFFRNLGNAANFAFVHTFLLPTLYARKLAQIENLAGIICIDAGAMDAARRVKKKRGVPFAYWAYEIYPNQFVDNPKALQRLMEKTEGDGCRAADLVIVTSNIWAKFLRRRYRAYGLKHKIVCVCPPPVKQFAELELSGKVKFYYHGAYLAGRGLENLVRAMRFVEGGELYLRGIGDEFERFLQAETARFKLIDRIKFLPPVPTEQLAEEATKFDVGVMLVCMTTLNAKFLIGFKTFENIAAGLPLFSPASYQLKEIVTQNKVGIIFRDCGEAALAETLQYCVAHKEKIREWKLNAREYAAREINPDYQRRQLLSAIENLTERRSL